MKTIPLTQGKVALVSDRDYPLVRQFKWCAQRIGNNWYALSWGSGAKFHLHRLLAGFPPFRLDHKNRDGLDNRRSNLRPIIGGQNQANSKLYSTNVSGYRGVSQHKGKWRARIMVDYRGISLGHFRSPEEAATAYGLAALSAFGEYAKLC